MIDLFEQLEGWMQEGKPVACATVISTFGSSPQPPGAKMFITAGGEMAGSVSAGCVESAVAQYAQEIIQQNLPRLVEFGVTNDQAAEVGLACGGNIRIFIEPVSPAEPLFRQIIHKIRNHHSAIMATIIRGPGLGKKWFEPAQHQPSEKLSDVVTSAIDQVIKTQQPVCINAGEEEEIEIFLDFFAPPPRLIVIGAVHTAISLVSMAKMVGFYTIVIDARAAFATRQRFPHADDLIKAYPPDVLRQLSLDETSYVVTLTHDEKYDNPSLAIALGHNVRYIGALGSRRTHQKRLASLRESGISDSLLSRIHAPVGLDLGGRTPEEIAVEIIAQITAVRRGIAI